MYIWLLFPRTDILQSRLFVCLFVLIFGVTLYYPFTRVVSKTQEQQVHQDDLLRNNRMNHHAHQDLSVTSLTFY